MIKCAIIVAMTKDRVIGKDGKIPWHYPEDLKRFKEMTLGHTVIMGRLTYESIGAPLAERRNIVISSNQIEGVEVFDSVKKALASVDTSHTAWLIGGRRIYEEGLRLADLLDITWVPDNIDPNGAILFPEIDEEIWSAYKKTPHEHDKLVHQFFIKRKH